MTLLTTRVTVPDRILFRDLAGEAVLLELESGRYYGLNESGTRIWQLLQSVTLLEAVHRSLLAECEVAPDRLRDDLLRFVELLASKGLLKIHEA